MKENRTMQRAPEIDAFRGLAIALMIFFTLTFNLSRSLPDILTHNQEDSIHIGDFVLPMFLFASGMSLVFFTKKREKAKNTGYALDVIERFGKLILVWIFLSAFSSGELFGMDELALSALLFLVTAILLRVGASSIILATIALMIMASYVILMFAGNDSLPDFSAHYLGGYPAAVFYLPVMLFGVIVGRERSKPRKLLELALASLALYFIFSLFVPPYKLIASPSFMSLSVSLSIFAFIAISKVKLFISKRLEFLEYLGHDPFRYWIMMFVLFIIPLYIYVSRTFTAPDIWWPYASVIALIILVIEYGMSKIIDKIMGRIVRCASP